MRWKYLIITALFTGMSLSLFCTDSHSVILKRRGLDVIYPLAAQVGYLFSAIGKHQREEFQGVEFPTIVGYLKFDKDNKAILEITTEYNFEELGKFFDEVNAIGSFVLSWKCGGGRVDREDENFLSAIECHLDANGINAVDIIDDPSKHRYSFKETRKFDINDNKIYREDPHILSNVIRDRIK